MSRRLIGAAGRSDARVRHQAANLATRHEEGLVARETDHLGLKRMTGRVVDQTAISNRRLTADRLERQPSRRVILPSTTRGGVFFRPSARSATRRRHTGARLRSASIAILLTLTAKQFRGDCRELPFDAGVDSE